MAYTTIDDPSAFFQCTLYVGNNGTQTVTHGGNSDIQSNLIWGKARNDTAHHFLIDSVRGVSKRLKVAVDPEATVNAGITAIGSDSFAVGNDGDFNDNNINYASWNWKAGTSFTNNAGANGANLATTAGSVNTDAGFSILKWNSSSMAGEGLLAHGLGVVPSVIMIKSTSGADDWYTYHKSLGATKYVRLNQNAAAETSSTWLENKTPTATLISLDNGFWGTSSVDYIAYCFAEKQGYSKFGSYTGNGNADGPFVHLGFKPAMVICKNSSASTNWQMVDNKRNTANIVNKVLYPDLNNAEDTVSLVDFNSNGFKVRNTTTDWNTSGQTIIYMAFAENPFVTSTGVPATAR